MFALCEFCINREGGTWEVGGVPAGCGPHGGCVGLVVKGTGWANSFPGCMRHRSTTLTFRRFISGRKALWALNRCLPAENADYCMLVIAWAWLKLRLGLLWLKVHLVSVWSHSFNRSESRVYVYAKSSLKRKKIQMLKELILLTGRFCSFSCSCVTPM